MEKKIREFIYLDIEIVKSILSQLDKGLLVELKNSSEKEANIEGKAGGGIMEMLLPLSFVGEGRYSSEKDETRVLHDYMYNYLEEQLLKENIIVKVDNTSEKYDGIPKNVNVNSYVLIYGKIRFEDYAFMQNIINNFNDISVAFETTTSGLTLSNKEDQWDEIKQNLRVDSKLFNEAYIRSLSLILSQFYKNRLMIKCMPFEKEVLYNFTGILKKDFLKEDMEDISFKYGFSPQMKWYIFGKITALPFKDNNPNEYYEDVKYKRIKEHWDFISKILNSAEEYKNLDKIYKQKWKSMNLSKEDFEILKGKNLEITFETMFDSLNSVLTETNVKFPTIKFTPIVIYRE